MRSFTIGDITLQLGDCLELMQAIPDQSIDLVLADLPYGTTQNKWDSVMQAVNERAAKLAATLAYDAAIKYADGYVVDFEDIGDAIRAASLHEGGGKRP